MKYFALFSVALLMISCTTADQPAAPGDPAPGEPAISVNAASAAPGETVRVSANGLPANTEVVVGAGPPNSEYDVLRRMTTDSSGRVEAEVAVPTHAAGDPLVFVVATPDARTKVISDRVLITSESGSVTVTGTVTDEGVECPAIRTPMNELYTIAGGDRDKLRRGARVRVTGTIAQTSFCMQGTTISATKIEMLE